MSDDVLVKGDNASKRFSAPAPGVGRQHLGGGHHDPFDRLLIAQARVEGLMTVSIGRVVIGVE